MNSQLIIKPATTEDIPKLVQLINKAYRGETAKKGWTHESDLLDGIRTDEASLTELIKNPEAVLLKCTDKAKSLLGCVHLRKKEEQLYLGMLTVLPEAQAGGLGKQILKTAENYAIAQKCKVIVMTVISVRHELIAWYERYGFYRTGETEAFPDSPKFGIPRQPLEFVVMKKNL